MQGFGRCDMDQGYIGNCWFIAGKYWLFIIKYNIYSASYFLSLLSIACVGLMQNEKLFAKVVPHQNFEDDYAGLI